MILIIFCEVVVIYGVIMVIVFFVKFVFVEGVDVYFGSIYFMGYVFFWVGLIVGMCNFVCGVVVGINGSGVVFVDVVDFILYVCLWLIIWLRYSYWYYML